MSNTLVNLQPEIVRETLLKSLESLRYPILPFTTDYSKDLAGPGDTVKSAVPGTFTAQTLSGTGYTGAAQDATTTAVNVTLNQNPVVPVVFTEAEILKYGADKLVNTFLVPMANGVRRAVHKAVTDLITTANFATELEIEVADMSYDTLVDLNTKLSENKVSGERHLFLNLTASGALKKDPTFKDSKPAVQQTFTKGVIGATAGFETITEDNDFQDNGEDLIGFAASKEAIVVAARSLPIINPGEFALLEDFLDPVTGLPMQVRLWHEKNVKKYVLSVECNFGVAKGVVGNLCRLVDITA
jgi:hypothetical protein